MRDVLAAEPLANPDYVSVADLATLAELDEVPDAAPSRWRSASAQPGSSTTNSSRDVTLTPCIRERASEAWGSEP